jgi:hypothetical protein
LRAARSRFNITTLNEALTSTKAREIRGQRPEARAGDLVHLSGSDPLLGMSRVKSRPGTQATRPGRGRSRTGRGGHFGNWELGTWKARHQRKYSVISFGEAAPSSSSPALNRHREGPGRTNLRHSSHDLNETPRILKILPCHSCQLCGNEPHPTPILDRRRKPGSQEIHTISGGVGRCPSSLARTRAGNFRVWWTGLVFCQD